VRIDPKLRSSAATRVRDAKTESAGGAPARREPDAVSDSVRLTSAAGKLRQMESELAELEVTDSAKVESIRQAIADGNFNVDEEAVADGLIQESIETLRARQ